ncbi:MAG TPA: O-methyltransferase [Mycobacteriales bacterium]|nr:O-methyltransferase [Mycobacteriales bacterium]
MSRSSPFLPDDVDAYAIAHAPAEDEVLTWLGEVTPQRFPDSANMQIAPDQGAFLTIMTQASRAQLAVEVGTFTGYSSVCIARGLEPGGRLICFDVSDEWTAIAREAWTRAGLDDRVELRLGPATETLPTLSAEGPVDVAFIDADKVGYIDYWEQLVPRMRPGGLIFADNVLQHGRVVDPSDEREATVAIRRFNDHVAADPRVDSLLLAAFDGLTVARRR